MRELPTLLKSAIYDRRYLKARLVRLYQLHSRKYKLGVYITRSLSNVYLSFVFDSKIRKASGQIGHIDFVLCHDQFTLNAAHNLAKASSAFWFADIVEITTMKQRSGIFLRETPWFGRAVLQFFTRRYLMSSTAAFTVSDSLKTYLNRLYLTRKFNLLRNFRDINDADAPVYNLRNELGLSSDAKLIAVINTIAPSYGVEETIEALQLLPENYHVVMIGRFTNDEYRRSLYELIGSLKLESRVHYLGQFGGLQFLSRLKSCDCGVNLLVPDVKNIEYSLPNRITDLIMAGVPIVSTKLPDVHAIIEKYGIGVSLEKISSRIIASSILKVTDNISALKMKANIGKSVKELNWQNESQVFMQVFEVEYAKWQKRHVITKEPFRACILARKPVTNNNRIIRLAHCMANKGFEVIIIANDQPESPKELECGSIKYISVDNISNLNVGTM